ncbi:DNA polymerase nu [Xyrauchen texanus]|uniref:DNA polymerase nu n=1 Tax=Xyrauchen texanus TaxID=154827 RepID=UPI00224268DB|nr:DNA polymerase nu [Xyrauchen texanus]
MESYLRSSLNAAPLSMSAQTVIAALRAHHSATLSSSQMDSLEISQLNFICERENKSLCPPSQEPKWSEDLSVLRQEVSKHFKLKNVICNERFALYNAGDDCIMHAEQCNKPVAQGDVSPLHGFTSKCSPQAKPGILTEPEKHKLKKRWIQPPSPMVYQHESPPVKKSFGQLGLSINSCHEASGEEDRCWMDNVDKQRRNGQIFSFWNSRSNSEHDLMSHGLTERDDNESSCEGISKEAKCHHNRKGNVAEVYPISLRSNVEEPKSKLECLETSFSCQDSRNLESCPHAQRCGSITVSNTDSLAIISLERDLDTSGWTVKSLSSEMVKEHSGSARREFIESRTSFPQLEEDAVQLPVGERSGELEPIVPLITEGLHHSIQSLSKAGKVISRKGMLTCSKHFRKWERPKSSQEALKITSSQERYRKTLRTLRFPTTSTSRKTQLTHQPTKTLQSGFNRHRHHPRPKKESKNQECNEPNHSKSPNNTEPCQSGSSTSNQMASETDRKGEMTAGTSIASFSLTTDSRVCDTGRLSQEERECMLEETRRAKAIIVTMVYQDGTIQLDPEQRSCPTVSGLLVLLKRDMYSDGLEDRPPERVLYLRLEQTPAWAQQDHRHMKDVFTREMLLQMVSSMKPFVCFKAKDLLRTVLRHFSKDLSWQQVLGCRVMDPQIAAWLLDPADSASCFQTLLSKHCTHPVTGRSPQPVLGHAKVTQVILNLSLLYELMVELQNKLQTRGLWQLYSGIEQKMIPVLAGMESYKMQVDKDALKRTSEMLGSKLKQLEQEAQRAAGQQFLVSSSAQLRLILFEKLRLHELCENKKLPKTIKQQQSTSETALVQLQHLHPLPKIILEYRQIHKIKTAFVDGILSCTNKTFISSTWNQTSTVSGRLSAKHPNFQALPKQPLQISKKQYVHGKNAEIVTVHPRAMFIPREGWTFLSADFCQVELRLLAHLSSDLQLLRIFQNPEADAFTMLAAQWKSVSEDRVSLEDREHAKRIVYSVVYGAGRERLSGILGVSTEEASRFQDSFLQTYREVQTFIQHTIQHCHKHGFVKSIMGRRRSLPHILSADWSLRNQAERQAVNFVLQGSAADLTKMAMIKICSLVSSSSSLTARLVAQIHDELLFEVEVSQVDEFAVLVKKTMESVGHIEGLGVNISVPLNVSLSTGLSWGSMREMSLPRTTVASH